MTDESKRAQGGGSAAGVTNVLGPVVQVPTGAVSELAGQLGLPGVSLPHQQLSLPVYGNYCGRGHGDPTGNTPPVDAVDAVCREHNACYGLLGDFHPRCDRNLIESMPNAIALTPTPQGKRAGFLILLYFSLIERNLALGETVFKRS